MTESSKETDLFQPLTDIYCLIEQKCNELPADINHWHSVAKRHDKTTKSYQNIMKSSGS